MAVAEILAVGSAADTASNTFTLASGDAANVSWKPLNNTVTVVPQDALGDIQYQTSDGGWINIGRLEAFPPIQQVLGPGVFRVMRRSGNVGVDRS